MTSPGQQPGIVRRVAADQQVVKIQLPDNLALALELDVPQGADGLDAAGSVERGGDRSQSADGVGAGIPGLAEHEHADGPRIGHGDAGPHADHLPLDPGFDVRLGVVEAQAADVDRPELREVDPSVAPDDQNEGAVLVAVELYLELVAGTQHVVRRHRNVRHRREGRRRLVEEVVPEGLQGGHAGSLQRQSRQAHVEVAQGRLHLQSQRGLLLGEPGKRDGRHAGQHQLAVTGELVGILLPDLLDELFEPRALGRRQVGRRVLRLLLARCCSSRRGSGSGRLGKLTRHRSTRQSLSTGLRTGRQTKAYLDDHPVLALQKRDQGFERHVAPARPGDTVHIRVIALAVSRTAAVTSGTGKPPSGHLPQDGFLLFPGKTLEDLELLGCGHHALGTRTPGSYEQRPRECPDQQPHERASYRSHQIPCRMSCRTYMKPWTSEPSLSGPAWSSSPRLIPSSPHVKARLY